MYLAGQPQIPPEIIKEEDIDSVLDGAIKKSLCICFPQHKEGFSQTRIWHGSGPTYSALIKKDNNIIAHTGVVSRTIKINDKEYKIAGVQNVFVLPSYRGKGFSDIVLKEAVRYAELEGYDFGLLFTDLKIKHVYARNGWIELPESKFIRIEQGCEIIMPEESIKMYYPLRDRSFPPGTVNLQGNDW